MTRRDTSAEEKVYFEKELLDIKEEMLQHNLEGLRSCKKYSKILFYKKHQSK